MGKIAYVLQCSPKLIPVFCQSLWAFEFSAWQWILDISSAVFIFVCFILFRLFLWKGLPIQGSGCYWHCPSWRFGLLGCDNVFLVIDVNWMCWLSVHVSSDLVAYLSMSATQPVSQHQKHLHASVTVNQQLWWQPRCLMTVNMKGDGVLSDLLGPLLHEDEEIWVVDEGLFTRVPKCQRKIQMEGGPQRWVVLWLQTWSDMADMTSLCGLIVTIRKIDQETVYNLHIKCEFLSVLCWVIIFLC